MKNLRVKLLLSLTIFALILVSSVSYINRQLLQSDIQERIEESNELIENHILSDMQTVDNAHYYFDTAVSNEMEHYLRAMVEQYEQDPNVLNWDIEKMKNIHGMDIYILNETNTVIHTTFEADSGFDFSECCDKFSALLDERRELGQFYTDGIDVSTTTGELRKYSYLATPDKKYMLELSVDLKNEPVFQTFNFENTAKNLVEKYDDLLEVKIINAGGVFIDNESNDEVSIKELPKQFRTAFYKANGTMKPVEYKKRLADGVVETYHFIPYEAEIVRGDSTKRVVYVKYGNSTKLALLDENTKQFWFVLFLALIIAFGMLVVIMRILSNTVNLATYDPLTGVFNRATYICKIRELFKKRKSNRPGLLLIDLDNFKQVNDQFGHAEGDIVLVETANMLEDIVGKIGFVARFGGDEFAIVIKDTKHTSLQDMGEAILRRVHQYKNDQSENNVWNLLSVSIGGATFENSDETELDLFNKADKALYTSKNHGKDQFSM